MEKILKSFVLVLMVLSFVWILTVPQKTESVTTCLRAINDCRINTDRCQQKVFNTQNRCAESYRKASENCSKKLSRANQSPIKCQDKLRQCQSRAQKSSNPILASLRCSDKFRSCSESVLKRIRKAQECLPKAMGIKRNCDRKFQESRQRNLVNCERRLNSCIDRVNKRCS